MKNINILIAILLIVSGFACSNKTVFEQNTDFVSESWHKDSTLVFSVDITDTINPYHVFFNTRITGQYNYQNIFLFIDTKLPQNKSTRDTLECILAEPNGKWLGKGFGNIWSYKIGYKKYIRFPYSGTYVFTIEQAMRTNDLNYVLDAGLSIEQASK